MSRGAVSMACRDLRDWGLVHARRVEGSRQLRYEPETDQETVIRSIVAMRKRREWDPILARLREWIPRLEARRARDAVVFRERLAAIEALVGMADRMAESFLGGGMVQKLGLKALVAAAARRSRKGIER
jgi:DNA-binding transcriptional regulator GbsR (MarR family)